MYTGSCLCGGVRFGIEGELGPIQICHCVQCRKAQGAPFATNSPVQSAAFTLLQGADLLKAYASSPGKERVFCGACGSPIYSQNASVPGVLRVRAGLINEPIRVQAVAHCYVATKCNWWPINDALPQFSERYVQR